MSKKNYYPTTASNQDIHPFQSVEELWFWFINANQALLDGAKYSAGLGLYNRPCQPADILIIVDRLRRNRRLLWDHIMVMSTYGRRQVSPDPYHHKEMRAATLWQEAMSVLEEVMIDKGFIAQQTDWPEIKIDHDFDEDQSAILSMTSANDAAFNEFK